MSSVIENLQGYSSILALSSGIKKLWTPKRLLGDIELTNKLHPNINNMINFGHSMQVHPRGLFQGREGPIFVLHGLLEAGHLYLVRSLISTYISIYIKFSCVFVTPFVTPFVYE